MRETFKNAFRNPLFWLAMASLLLCFLGFSLPMWIERCAQGDRQYMSAFSQGFSPIFFGGAILILPFAAAVANAPAQVTQIRTGFVLSEGLRGSVMKYSLTHYAATLATGAVAMGMASIFHSGLWNIVAGVYDASNPDIQVMFSPGTVYETLEQSPYAITAFLHAALGFALSGALWSAVALVIATWIPDTLLAVTIPVLLYYFWTYGLFGNAIPPPNAIYNDGQTWAMYRQSVLTHLALFAALGIAYYVGVRRRLCHA